MLKEDQVAELLRRSEKALGKCLRAIRGNLKKSSTRTEAIWELIGIEEFAHLVKVVHEPKGASRPDLIVNLEGADTAIDFTVIHSRYWKNEQRRESTERLIREALDKCFGSSPSRVNPADFRTHYEGRRGVKGRIQSLPDMHLKNEILKHPELLKLIDSVKANPSDSSKARLEPYDVDITYQPGSGTTGYAGSSSVGEGHSSTPSENAIYRKIGEKHKQHKLQVPLFLCIYGDERSPIVHSMGDKTIQNRAIFEAFDRFRNVSGIRVSKLHWPLSTPSPKPALQHAVYKNINARYPISPEFWELLQSISFNRWTFTFSEPKWERNPIREKQSMGGHLTVSGTESGNTVLSLPAQLVFDAIQGKTNVYEEYRDKPNDFPRSFFELGWDVVGVNFVKSEVEGGTDDFVEFTLARSGERVFK